MPFTLADAADYGSRVAAEALMREITREDHWASVILSNLPPPPKRSRWARLKAFLLDQLEWRVRVYKSYRRYEECD